MLLLANPVEFGSLVDVATSDWVGIDFSVPAQIGLSYWGDRLQSFLAGGKRGIKVKVVPNLPFDPGLFIRVSPDFLHKGVDRTGEHVPYLWMVVEVYQNDPASGPSPDVQIYYDAQKSRFMAVRGGPIYLSDSSQGRKWRSYVLGMPSPYFNMRSEPYTGRARDISIVPLSDPGSWIAIKKVVLLKKKPYAVLTLNTDKAYVLPGQKVLLSAEVLDSNGNPVQGEKVSFEVLQGKAKLSRSWAYTDSQGVASVYAEVFGDRPLRIKATLEGVPPSCEKVVPTLVNWDFGGSQQGWDLSSHFSYEPNFGRESSGCLKFNYQPEKLFTWSENNSSLISNPTWFSWDNSFGYDDTFSVKFEYYPSPQDGGPNTVDPNGDNVSQFLLNPDFSGDSSGWSYSSEFSYNGSVFHDAPGSMEYISGDGVSFGQIVNFTAEGIGSTSFPLWVGARAWIQRCDTTTGAAYIDLNNAVYDKYNSPSPPTDGKWHLVAVYDYFDYSTVDPDGSWGSGDELKVRGIRDSVPTGSAFFDDFQIEIGWRNPNPSFEIPEVTLGTSKGGWDWDWSLTKAMNNILFKRVEGSYSGVLPKDGNAFVVAEIGSGATNANLRDRVPLVKPGSWYMVSGWIYLSEDFDGRAYIDLYSDDYTTDPELSFHDLVASSPGWNYVKTIWQCPADWNNSIMTLNIRCVIDSNPTSGFVCFDDVEIYEINQPPSWPGISNAFATVTLNAGEKVVLSGWIFRNLESGTSYCDVWSPTASDGPNALTSVNGQWSFVKVEWICDNSASDYQVRAVTDYNGDPQNVPIGQIWWDEVNIIKYGFLDENSYKVVKVEPFKSYKISGWIYVDEDFSGTCYIDIYNDTASDPELGFPNLEPESRGRWEYVSSIWTNTYGVDSIKVRVAVEGYPSGTVYFDDIKVEEVELLTEGVITDTVTIVPTEFLHLGVDNRIYNLLQEDGVEAFVEGPSGNASTLLFQDSFDSDLSNWSTTDSGVYSWNGTEDHTGGASGSLYARPKYWAQSIKTISTFNVEGGKIYRLSFWIKGSFNLGNWYSDFADCLGDYHMFLGPSENWTYYSVYWSPPMSQSINVRLIQDRDLWGNDPKGYILVDDLKFEGISTSTVTWGMGFCHDLFRNSILTRADPSNPNSSTLKIRVEPAFFEKGDNLYLTVEYSGSTLPQVNYTSTSGISSASLVLQETSLEQYNYAVFLLENVNFTGLFEPSPDILLFDGGSQMKIAGLWLSKETPIPAPPQLEDTFSGVKIDFPEEGRWAIYRGDGSEFNLIAVWSGSCYIDENVQKGKKYFYRLARVFGEEIFSPLSPASEVRVQNILGESEVSLEKNIFNLGERILLHLNADPHEENVRVELYSLSGFLLEKVEEKVTGFYELSISTNRNWAPGVYILEVHLGEKSRRFNLIFKNPP